MSRREMKKTFKYLLAAIILALIFLPGFIKLNKLKEENRFLAERISALVKRNDELKAELDRLKNDPAYIEKIAREKLGMVKKGERLYKIPQE